MNRSYNRSKGHKGLFDAILTIALIYGVYAHTPVGALAETGYRIIKGQKHRPSLFATFKGYDTEVNINRKYKLAGIRSQFIHDSINRAAKKYKIDPYLLLSIVQTNGKCNKNECYVSKPRYITKIINLPEKKEFSIERIAHAIYKAEEKLGYGNEPAIEALYCGVQSVRRTIHKARISGMKAYSEASVHAPLFPPGIRRGELQDALAVLARYRIITLQWPMNINRKITSPFGMRTHPIKKTKRMHSGIDISAPIGHPTSSVHKGIVHRVARDSVFGKWLKIDHGFGIFSTYCHLNSIIVRKKDWVKRKQVVAKSGNSGRSTGPHLHYALRINRELVNPMKYGFSPKNVKRDIKQ